MSKKESCKDCRFFYIDKDKGFCRKNPPKLTVFAMPTQTVAGPGMGFATHGGHPPVKETDWCGAYEKLPPILQ